MCAGYAGLSPGGDLEKLEEGSSEASPAHSGDEAEEAPQNLADNDPGSAEAGRHLHNLLPPADFALQPGDVASTGATAITGHDKLLEPIKKVRISDAISSFPFPLFLLRKGSFGYSGRGVCVCVPGLPLLPNPILKAG